MKPKSKCRICVVTLRIFLTMYERTPFQNLLFLANTICFFVCHAGDTPLPSPHRHIYWCATLEWGYDLSN
jgi:hypothetical protein